MSLCPSLGLIKAIGAALQGTSDLIWNQALHFTWHSGRLQHRYSPTAPRDHVENGQGEGRKRKSKLILRNPEPKRKKAGGDSARTQRMLLQMPSAHPEGCSRFMDIIPSVWSRFPCSCAHLICIRETNQPQLAPCEGSPRARDPPRSTGFAAGDSHSWGLCQHIWASLPEHCGIHSPGVSSSQVPQCPAPLQTNAGMTGNTGG